MKKISLLIVAMMILVSCTAKAPTDENANVKVDANWTEVNVWADWVQVDTDWTSVDVWADGVQVDTDTDTETTTETTTTETTTTTEDTSSSDSSSDWDTSVKIDGNSVDVNAGWLDVKIN